MSESKSPFDRLIEIFVGAIFALVLIQCALAFVVNALARAWNATLGQPAVGLLFKVLFWLVILAFGAGLLVRAGHALGNFWRSILDQFHGPRAERSARARGAEHLDGAPRPRRRRVHEDDPPLPLEGP